MAKQLSAMIGFLLAGASLATGIYPHEVSDYIQRRELCEHFRAEPWPEGASDEERERRDYIALQLKNYCNGTDRALRELKVKYRYEGAVMDRLEKYEAGIESER